MERKITYFLGPAHVYQDTCIHLSRLRFTIVLPSYIYNRPYVIMITLLHNMPIMLLFGMQNNRTYMGLPKGNSGHIEKHPGDSECFTIYAPKGGTQNPASHMPCN